MDITIAFPLLMIQEGGGQIVNIAGDAGHLTKFGIAQKFHPTIDVANLTKEQAEDIYLDEYWNPGKCSQLPNDLIYIHFSMCVNMGIGGAAKVLQKACNVMQDGIIGSATLGAAIHISIQDYAIACAERYKEIVEADPSQQKFMAGWQLRIDTILKWFKAGKLA